MKSQTTLHFIKRFGAIPPEWDKVAIGELFTERQEFSDDVAKFPLNSLTIETGITPKTDRYDRTYLLRDEDSNQYKLVYPGDFVFNPMNLRFGAIAYSRHASIVSISGYYHVLRPQDGRFDPVYLYELLKSPVMMKSYDSIAIGSLVEKRRVYWSELRDFVIPLPQIEEQAEISIALRTWDQAIALTERRITAGRQRAQAMVQRLLSGQVRDRAFIGSVGRTETPCGDLPSDWNYVTITSIATEVGVRNTEGSDFPVLSCTKHNGLVDSLAYFGRRVYSGDTAAYKLVKRGQFAYATNHIEEGSIGYQSSYDVALISPMYTVFETDYQVDDDFLYRVLKTEKYRRIFETSTNGTVNRRGSLRWKEFSQIRVPLPSLPEQHRITEVLAACDHELDLLARKRDALQRQKRGLMQQLLSGRVRVKE